MSKTTKSAEEIQRIQKLATDNHRLIYEFLHRWNLNREDYYDIVSIGFMNACHKFNEDSGYNFSTYAFACMKNEVIKEQTASKRKMIIPKDMIISYNQPITAPERAHQSKKVDELLDILPGNENVENCVIIKDAFSRALASFKEKNQTVIRAEMSGYSTVEAANMVGVTRQRTSSVLLAYKNKVREILNMPA